MKLHVRLALCVLVLSAIGCGGRPAAKPPAKPPSPAVRKSVPPPSPFKRPENVRGIYVTAWFAGSTKQLDKLIGLLDRTELNAMVIDVRDAGENYWKGMDLKLSDQSGATRVAVVHPKKVMAKLLAKGVYPIARIACFRDNYVPLKRPDRAVNVPTGGVWRDRGGYAWLDPYNRQNWEYIGAVVDYALELGFPEIQLDYVRFPSEGKANGQRFPAKKAYADPKAQPEDVVVAFANFIRSRVKARQAVFSADIFGIISISKRDQGIGQELEKLAEPFDLMCPMVYPSHFAKGEYGVRDPSAQPYKILMKSLGDYKRRLPNKPIRPWIQDFFGYGVPQVQAQIKAAKELGYDEYLLWNARNAYTEAAVRDTSRLVSVQPQISGKSD